MPARRIAIALAVLGGTAALVLGWSRGHHTADVATPARGGLAGWPTGIERGYRCELATRAELPPGGTVRAGTLVDLRTTGRLALTVMSVGPDVVVRAQLVPETLALTGSAAGDTAASREDVRRSLARPFFLTFRPTGELAGVRAGADTIPLVTGLFGELGRAVRLTAQGASDGEITEEDAGGAYVARFRVLAESPRRVSKQKLRYFDGATTVVASETELEFEGMGALRGLRGRERLRSAREPVPGLEVTTEITLAQEATADRRLELAAWARELAELRDPPAAGASEPAVPAAQVQQLLATLRAHALAKAAGGTPSKDDRQRAVQAYASLTALLRQHPEQLAFVRAQIVDGSPLASTLIAALRDAGTPEAQDVLRDLLTEPRAAERRPRIARGLSLVANPTEATVEALRALQDDEKLGVQATYGLGSAVHRLREREPERAAKVLALLVKELEAADTRSRTVEVLNALGNAGHPDALSASVPYLGAADELVRAAATRSLRRVPGTTADELLARAANDPSAEVRASAMEAISERQPAAVLVAALATRLVEEPEFSIRARAVHIATAWLGQARAMLAAPLARVAENDASPDLRGIARSALH